MILQTGDVAASVDLLGGRLASLVIGDHEVLVTGDSKATRWGSFPMVPWCGRLRNAVLDFEGERWVFPSSAPPHASHGFGHTQMWIQTGETEISTDLVEPWPFGGRVTQRFDLAEDCLTVTIEVETTTGGSARMPAMAGWHPWFRRELGGGGEAQLVMPEAKMYELDDTAIPTGELVEVPPGPWDNCFTQLDAHPVIRWPGVVELELSSTFDHWVVFTRPAHALCVEPQSGPPNELNTEPFVVTSDRPLAGSMTLRWRDA